MFTGQAGRGEPYTALQPCIVIFILAYPELPGARLHPTFRVLEVRDQTLFSNAFELHAVELPKLPRPEQTESDEQLLANWARFLAAGTDEEREEVAMNNPDIHQAQETLERLSLDPAARELARRREDALFLYKAELQKARAEGRAEGEARGETRMLHSSIRALCKVLEIPVDGEREAQLERMTRNELQRVFDALQNERRWP